MESLLAQCGLYATGNGSVFASVLAAGLVGSLTHCSTMCGPIVAAQMALLESAPGEVSFHLLLWYHAGRIATYALLGAVAAAGSGWVFGSDWFPAVSGAMLLVAGGLFIASAIRPRSVHACRCGQRSALAASIARRMPLAARLYLKGMLMGFMPCGLLLAALLLVATTQQAAVGVLAMLVFGLSTLPVLQGVGYGAHRASLRWRTATAVLGRGVMTINGLVLCGLGMNAM